MKKIIIALSLSLLFLAGCSSSNNKYEYSVIDVPGVGTNEMVSLIVFTSGDGDMYYRVLPNIHTMESENLGFNGYSVDWIKVPNPTMKQN